MGFLYSLLFPWNLVLQAIAIVHFIRRRPDNYWLWIILIGGWIGAVVYIFAEVLEPEVKERISKEAAARVLDVALDYARQARACLNGELHGDELEALTHAVVDRER